MSKKRKKPNDDDEGAAGIFLGVGAFIIVFIALQQLFG